MLRSLVGSEMCIRDSYESLPLHQIGDQPIVIADGQPNQQKFPWTCISPSATSLFQPLSAKAILNYLRGNFMNQKLTNTLQWIRQQLSDLNRANLFANRRPATQRLNYQSFEARRLLAGIVFNEATGEVQIGGTNDDDRALVTQSGNTVTVTQEGFSTETFPASSVNFCLLYTSPSPRDS